MSEDKKGPQVIHLGGQDAGQRVLAASKGPETEKERAERALTIHQDAEKILTALVQIEEHRARVLNDLKVLRRRGKSDGAKYKTAAQALDVLNSKRKEAHHNYKKYCAHALQVFVK